MHDEGLASNPPELSRIGDRAGSGPVVHVALTARCEPDSGLVSGLKESERAQPERQEREEAPACGGAERNTEQSEDSCDRKHDEAEPAPPRLAPRSDVRDEGDGYRLVRP
jgi:hypothetical protein